MSKKLVESNKKLLKNILLMLKSNVDKIRVTINKEENMISFRMNGADFNFRVNKSIFWRMDYKLTVSYYDSGSRSGQRDINIVFKKGSELREIYEILLERDAAQKDAFNLIKCEVINDIIEPSIDAKYKRDNTLNDILS